MKEPDMIDSPARRALLGIGLAGGLSALGMARARAADGRFASARPAPGQRRFVSPAVDAAIADLQRRIGDPELAWMFGNCLPNTLDTTVTEGTVDGKPDTFVITGDIDAMWLRDSSAQVWPYLPFAREDDALRRLIRGVIRRHARCLRGLHIV